VNIIRGGGKILPQEGFFSEKKELMNKKVFRDNMGECGNTYLSEREIYIGGMNRRTISRVYVGTTREDTEWLAQKSHSGGRQTNHIFGGRKKEKTPPQTRKKRGGKRKKL